MGSKGQAPPTIRAAFQAEAIARQGLAIDDFAQFEGKALLGRQAAGFEMEMREIEAPAALLAPTMLAHQAV